MAKPDPCFVEFKDWLNKEGHAAFISICLVAIMFQAIAIIFSMKDPKLRGKTSIKFFALHFLGNTVVLINYIWSSSTFIVTGVHTCSQIKCSFMFHQNAGCISVISLLLITRSHYQELLNLGTIQTKSDYVKKRKKTLALTTVFVKTSLILTASAVLVESNRLIGVYMLYETCLIILCLWYCYRSFKVPWHGIATSPKTLREVSLLKTNETIILLSIVLTICPRMLNIAGDWIGNKIKDNNTIRTFILCVAKMYILGLLLKPVVFVFLKKKNLRKLINWRGCCCQNQVTVIEFNAQR